MLLFLTFLSALGLSVANNQNQFCADMKPQNSVDIEQLMGMWFGIEIIIHNTEGQHMVKYYDTCPVIFLSEMEDPINTTPYPRGYSAAFGYGTEGRDGRAHVPKYTTTTDRSRGSSDDHGYGIGRYAGDAGRGHGQGHLGNAGNTFRHHGQEEMKRMRLRWEENGFNIFYSLRYSPDKAGFWISSEPQNGSMLEKQYEQFAGTIQVMKAVGNHMLLTFCHQIPDRQLFSLLLSRERRLSDQDVLGIHNLLNRRNLDTINIRKVCNNSSDRMRDSFLCLLAALGSVMWLKMSSMIPW